MKISRHFRNTHSRQNHISACSRRFAGRKSLTLPRKLSGNQCSPTNLAVRLGRLIVDALVFEFMGLAMLALCVIVLAVPAARRPVGRHTSDF
jgi:hypothetical protein